ncbi:MAG: hypothetical protein GY751_23095 [Bacteroidetes bacterium]|nr:hypothetical protein [Bacteroidota bacterium]
MHQSNFDTSIARRILGNYMDGKYKESIEIEYRYTRYADRSEWVLYTSIVGKEYRITDGKYFGAFATLLDQLPLTSVIMIPHQITISRNGVKEVVVLEEWLFPFEDRDAGNTVVYQLALPLGDNYYKTPKRLHGYLVIDFRTATECLRVQLGDGICLHLCYFCKFLIEYNDFGGTDYRHDQLYCFRDDLEAFEQLLTVYPILRDNESLLDHGLPDMNALHSCSAFEYRKEPRL